MKMLLTSNGLVNDSILQAFVDMSPKPINELTVAFIPTAKNRSGEDKRYFLRVLSTLDRLGVKKIDFVDIDSVAKEHWLPRLEKADVIYVGGGNTYYLLNSVRLSGLDEELPRLLETKMYVGDSAGAIIVTPSIDIAAVDNGDENFIELQDTSGLNYVDFEISPHSPEDVTLEENEKYAISSKCLLYAFNNNTALKYNNGNIAFVGERKYWIYKF